MKKDKSKEESVSATAKKNAVKKKAVKKKAAKKAVRKKAVKKAAKKTVKKKVAKQATEISPRERYEMIATMAYYRAEKRNFAPGQEQQDWYECERIVDEMLAKL